MKRKLVPVLIAALALWVVVGCTPQTAEPPSEAAVAEPVAEQAVVEEAPTVAQVAEEPATPTAVPTNTAVPEPTEAPAEEEVAEAADAEVEEVVEDEQPDDAAMAESSPVQFGRTEEGAFFYGSPTADITLIDHSDFL